MMCPKRLFGARIGRVDLVGLAALVVGQHDVDAPGDRMRFHVLRPIHRRGAEQVAGAPRVDHHVGLTVKSVGRRQRTLTVNQRQPAHLAVGLEARGIERPAVEQVAVRLRSRGIVFAIGDELVDVFHARIVARVEGDAPVVADRMGRALVRRTAERSALDRRGLRIVRIDLDDPAEAVRLVALLVEVEAIEIPAPGFVAAAPVMS